MGKQHESSPPSHTPRWRRRKEARPAELIAAALDLFAERGFAGTKIEDVAARAGVTKGTIYLYFGSKEALLEAVVRETIVSEIERAERHVDEYTGSARELLETYLRNWWHAVGETKLAAIAKLMMAESASFPDLAAFYVREVVQRGRRLLARVLERGVASGEFRSVDVPQAVRVVLAPLLHASMWRQSFFQCEQMPLDVEAYLRTHIDLVMHGITASPREDDSDHA